MTLVDSNVLIDVLAHDADWETWSLAALQRQSSASELLINEIVYAELAARYNVQETLNAVIAALGVRLDRMPLGALYRAGRAFQTYRERRGTRTSLLPDFFIGAHAQVVGLPILTRDTRRYRTYFPDVDLIAPE